MPFAGNKSQCPTHMQPKERKWCVCVCVCVCVCKGDEQEMHLLPFFFFFEYVSAEAQMFPEIASPFLGVQHISSHLPRKKF